MAQRKRGGTRRSTKKTSSRSASARRSVRSPDALRMLKNDHQQVKQLFERFERTRGGSQKERLAGTICNELKVHAQLEEELFYPAVRQAISDSDLMNEAEVEHASAKDLIGQIEASSPSDERYDALVTVLGEYVRHHIDEEEGEMFEKVRRSELDLAALGRELQERKQALVGEKEKAPSRGVASMLFGRTGS